MTPKDRDIQRKLKILKHAEETADGGQMNLHCASSPGQKRQA